MFSGWKQLSAIKINLANSVHFILVMMLQERSYAGSLVTLVVWFKLKTALNKNSVLSISAPRKLDYL